MGIKINPMGLRAVIDAGAAKSPHAISESPAITAQYFKDINALVLKVAKLVREKVFPILDKYEFEYAKTDAGQSGFRATDGLFADDDMRMQLLTAFKDIDDELKTLDAYAQRVATNRMMQTDAHNRRAFVESFKKTVGVDVSKLLGKQTRHYGKLIDPGTVMDVQQAIQNNVDLIKTVPAQHLAKIQQTIVNGINSGSDAFSLRNNVLEINGQNTRRAKVIARDQLQKLNGALVQSRQRGIGIDGYYWRTSHDERVRQSHKDNDGKRFQWDSPPSGTGHPGEDIQCRCVAEPDLSRIQPGYTEGLKPQPKAVPIVNPLNVLPKAAKPKAPKAPKAPATRDVKIAKVEDRIYKNKTESAVLFDKDGNKIFRQGGSKSAVYFSPSQVKQMEGMTLTHNHPSGNPFSGADFNLFVTGKLDEVRAAGKYHNYSLTGVSTNTNAVEVGKAIDNTWAEAKEFARKEYYGEAGRKITDKYNAINDEFNKKRFAIRGKDLSREQIDKEFTENVLWRRREIKKLSIEEDKVLAKARRIHREKGYELQKAKAEEFGLRVTRKARE